LRGRIDVARAELAAGRLLRVLAAARADGGDAGCAARAKELATLCASAAASLGDPEGVKRCAAEATAGPATLFDPDGPVSPAASEADDRAEYTRAVAAYEAGAWPSAESAALRVGAGARSLAADAFVLAARSAERCGDAARAARMWARAHRAACTSPDACVVGMPSEGPFAVAASLGAYAPWKAEDLCPSRLAGRTVVNRRWEVSAWRSGFDVHEVPSRVLLEHVDAGENSELFCLSRNGEHRVWVMRDEGTNRLWLHQGSRRGAMTDAILPPLFTPEPGATYVGDDGSLVFWWGGGDPILGFDSTRASLRRVPIARPIRESWGRPWLGDPGFLYAGFTDVQPPPKPWRSGVLRFDVATGKGVVLFDDATTQHNGGLGRVDDRGRLLAFDNQRIRWFDGRTGKLLAEMKSPESLDAASMRELGVVPPSTVVWRDHSEHTVVAADVATGTVRNASLLWHPPHTSRDPRNLETLTRVLGELPMGDPPRRWSDAGGFRVDAAWEDGVWVDVTGKGYLKVALAADRKGALVVADDGRFEIVGQVPDAFRASLWCGHKGADQLPVPGRPQRPVEVCAAAFEERGLVAAWLGAASTVPRSSSHGAD
jgi:hypothetical protein